MLTLLVPVRYLAMLSDLWSWQLTLCRPTRNIGKLYVVSYSPLIKWEPTILNAKVTFVAPCYKFHNPGYIPEIEHIDTSFVYQIKTVDCKIIITSFPKLVFNKKSNTCFFFVFLKVSNTCLLIFVNNMIKLSFIYIFESRYWLKPRFKYQLSRYLWNIRQIRYRRISKIWVMILFPFDTYIN